jgi:type VI secretion system secreted protein VgrG
MQIPTYFVATTTHRGVPNPGDETSTQSQTLAELASTLADVQPSVAGAHRNKFPAPDHAHAQAPVGVPKQHQLGAVSEKYESGGRGAGTVSTGTKDPGGVSYGTYQLASKTGTVQKFLAHEGAAWAGQFKGMDPTVSKGDFEKNWKAAAAKNPQEFAKAQHAFIERTHFQPVVDAVNKATGVDLGKHAPAVQDAVWSSSVQHGSAAKIIAKAVKSVTVPPTHPNYDRDLINAIYKERTSMVENLHTMPKETRDSLVSRYQHERLDALKLLEPQTAAQTTP